jgi:hypothetical protein
MARKLDYRWNLRQVMASRDMFQTTDLAPLLAERGIGKQPYGLASRSTTVLGDRQVLA